MNLLDEQFEQTALGSTELDQTLVVVNKVPYAYNVGDVQEQVEQKYSVEVAAVLPHSDDLMAEHF